MSRFDESAIARADLDLAALLEEHGSYWDVLPVLGFDVEAVRCSAEEAAKAFEQRLGLDGEDVREPMAVMLVVYGVALSARLTAVQERV